MTTNLELFATTALIALFSSVVATILGYPIGNWLAGTGRGTRQLVSSFLLVPFLLPPFLIGIALLPLQPNTFNSITGILWIIGAHVLMNAGFMARVVSANQIPADQLEAASLDGASGLLESALQLSSLSSLPGCCPRVCWSPSTAQPATGLC